MTAVEEIRHDGYPTHRRKVRFDWSHTPLHWVPDDPFSTHMLNELHLLLPAGERWFIRVVDEAAPLVDDSELEAAIKPFIQQESWHAWAHQVVLDHLAEQGIDTKPYTQRLEKWLAKLGNQRTNWPEPLQRWWLYRRVADVAALEHFTAVLGQWVIQNRGLDYAGTDPVMLDLLRWHGAEEIEHRSLVFDIYQNICGNYVIRAFSMLMTAPLFVSWWIAGARYLMASDPTIDAKWRWRDWLRAGPRVQVAGTVADSRDGAAPLHAAQPSPEHRGVDANGDGLPRTFARRDRCPGESRSGARRSRPRPLTRIRAVR
ncbi:metal-dependent hydrolase [Mycobacterium ostraviense]|uniref:metal-dependent hydrolase n=1 Tax=Mycobacterium ostraviense TaxID=2738409 RepID=UPI000B10096F